MGLCLCKNAVSWEWMLQELSKKFTWSQDDAVHRFFEFVKSNSRIEAPKKKRNNTVGIQIPD